MSIRIWTLIVSVSLISTIGTRGTLADWPHWRGPRHNGSINEGKYPVSWDADGILWKTPLPGKGCSTPIVWKERIYVTCPMDGQDTLLAIDWSGKKLWHVQLGPEDPGKHRNGSGSNCSPVTDGTAIFVHFKSGVLAAIEFDGQVRWKTNLVERFGPVNLFWDHGTSPVLSRDNVIMARMHHGESWLAAFDKQTGEMRWKEARNYETPNECDNGYTSPLVLDHAGEEAILVWGAEHVTMHAADSGKLLWSCGQFNPEKNALWPAIASPVVVDDMAIIAYGRHDRGLPRLHGIRMGGSGDVTATHRAWDRTDAGTFVPTPAEYQGKLFLVGDRGEVVCLDPASGQTIWKDNFPKKRAAHYASPVIAGGNLYAASEDGVVYVANIENGFQLLAENKMGESIIASPIAVSNRLILRGEHHLYCVTAR